MSESSEKLNLSAVISGSKTSTEIYDSAHGSYKDACAELEGHQVAPKHEPSPFTAGGSNPKEK
jgi:hypothetical protein